MNSGNKPVHRHFPTHLGGSYGMGWVFKTNNYSRTCSSDLICGIVSLGVERDDRIYRIWIKVHFSTARNETEYSLLKNSEILCLASWKSPLSHCKNSYN